MDKEELFEGRNGIKEGGRETVSVYKRSVLESESFK